MKEKIIALLWTWINSYEYALQDTLAELRQENIYGKSDSVVTEIEVATDEGEPHLLGRWYCNLLPALTDWLDLTDLMCESAEQGPQVLYIFTDSTKGIVQVYFDKTHND